MLACIRWCCCAQVSIERLHVRYEDEVTDASQPLTMGIVIDSLQFNPCKDVCCVRRQPSLRDAAAQAVLNDTQPRLQHHMANWTGLAVYLNPGNIGDVFVASASSADNWTGLDMDKVQVLLAPSSGRLSLTRTRLASDLCALL